MKVAVTCVARVLLLPSTERRPRDPDDREVHERLTFELETLDDPTTARELQWLFVNVEWMNGRRLVQIRIVYYLDRGPGFRSLGIVMPIALSCHDREHTA